MKRPAFQFYPADWRKDVELRSCSIAARGLWIDILCIAHECDPYGHLAINGRPMTATKLAGQVGLTAAQCKTLLDELIENGVARIDGEGVIYSKRMVQDEDVRNRRADGGKAGSEHGKKGAEHGIKGGRPRKERRDLKTPLKTPLVVYEEPPPSSSSSSSPSGNKEAEASLSPGKPDAIPHCPHGELLDLFAEHLPMLPQPKPELWTGARAAALKARWRWVLTAKKRDGSRYASNHEEALSWFRRFFAYVAESDFLTGRDGKWTACDLGWLCNESNFAKVLQGNYDCREVA